MSRLVSLRCGRMYSRRLYLCLRRDLRLGGFVPSSPLSGHHRRWGWIEWEACFSGLSMLPGRGTGSRGEVARRSPAPVYVSPMPSFPINQEGELAKRASVQRVIDFGGILEADTAGIRSSGRIRAQQNADDTQMERAMMLAARRDSYQGTNLNKAFSILSFSDKQIMDRAASLGVSLGMTEAQSLASAQLIKQSELDRTVSILQNNLKPVDDPHCLILNRAASLSEDIEEDDFSKAVEDIGDFAVAVEKVKKTRKRKDYSYAHRRRSARIKVKSRSRDV